MSNFLDKTGLSYFWNKIKSYINSYGIKLRTVTLTASDWTNNTKTVAVSGVVSDQDKQAIDVAAADKNSADVWAEAGIWCSNQGENSLTFSCETVPTSDIFLNVKLQKATN